MPLRWALRGQGYWVHAWQLGRNIGPTARAVDGMRQRIEELHDQHGRRVTLIGQSLGGIYARLLARENPDSSARSSRSAARTAWSKVTAAPPRRCGSRSSTCTTASCRSSELREQDRPPLLVPATSIYSRTDGVAPWQTCIDDVREHAENIEIVRHPRRHGASTRPCSSPCSTGWPSPRTTGARSRPAVMLRSWYPRPASWRQGRRGPATTTAA